MKERNLKVFLLGNGETICDTSTVDKETNDYPIIAHISDEGVIDRCEKDISIEDYRFIKSEAEKVRSKFYEEWDKLTTAQQYEKLLDKADVTTLVHIDYESNDMTMEQKITKYMPYILFKEGNRPNPDTDYNCWITFYNASGINFVNDNETVEKIKNAANNPSFGSVLVNGAIIELLIKADAKREDVFSLVDTAQENNCYLNLPSARFISYKFGEELSHFQIAGNKQAEKAYRNNKGSDTDDDDNNQGGGQGSGTPFTRVRVKLPEPILNDEEDDEILFSPDAGRGR